MNKKIKKILRPPYHFFLYQIKFPLMGKFCKKTLINKVYKKVFGKKIDFDNPQDLNEKINWLKLYGDTSKWPYLADKYKVREYLKEQGLEDILVPLYGVWDSAHDIDWTNLPSSFVLKTNHGSGDCIVVKNKNSVNRNEIENKLQKFLRRPFGIPKGEFHYVKIFPKIIAEKLLLQENLSFTETLVDYKVWCFSGKPFMIWACYNRTKESVYVESYDLEWHYHPEWSNFTEHYRDGKGVIPKPESLDKMISAAMKLSNGFPQVRVDFYDINGILYFGELTFTSNGGYNDFYTPEHLKKMGDLIILPSSKRK